MPFETPAAAVVVTSRDLAGTWSPMSSRSATVFIGSGAAVLRVLAEGSRVGLFLSVEEGVRAGGGVGEVSGVGVEVAAGGLDGLVSEDALEDVEGDAGVGEPGCSGVTEPVPGEARQFEVGDELIPFRCVP